MSKPTKKLPVGKPPKPYADFPLFPHATRRWAKKIRGKLHYFGPWEDWEAALALYQKQAPDLHAGRTPREDVHGLTVRDLVNRFLTTKRHLVDTHELVERSWQDYHLACGRVLDALGKDRLVTDLGPDDFESLRRCLAKTRGVVALGNEVARVRILFKYAYDAGLIDRPVRYGQSFKRPSRKALRKARQEKGLRMFQADEINALLAKAPVHMKAMILLGVNCAFGPADCGHLPIKALDLKAGWVDFPRPKTGVPRRCPLWAKTIAALRKSMANRPKPRDEADGGLVFLTKYGQRWAKDSNDSPISKEFAKLIKTVKVKRGRKSESIQRKGLGLYALRHTFQTIGDGARDPIATRAIMGHAEAGNDMSAVYREGVEDGRLKAVTDHVHRWLFGADLAAGTADQGGKKQSAGPG
jgi:integrase